jgi:hypothetical protein
MARKDIQTGAEAEAVRGYVLMYEGTVDPDGPLRRLREMGTTPVVVANCRLGEGMDSIVAAAHRVLCTHLHTTQALS